jgi:hypothetical protein
MNLPIAVLRLLVFVMLLVGALQATAQEVHYPTEILYPEYYDTSPPLSELIASAAPWEYPITPPIEVGGEGSSEPSGSGEQICVQNYFGTGPSLSTGVDFEGIGYSGITPPDPNGAVGPHHYFQVVNSHFAILDRHSIA